MRVLVTGGTGELGSRVARRLADREHEVRVLTRRPEATVEAGCERVVGDVRTGAGLAEAASGVEAIVHAATRPEWRARATEVGGTQNLVEAAERLAPDAHLIYVSIVGVDEIPYLYYRAKWEAEQVVEASSVPWTIQRATQFHSLLFERFMVASTLVMPRGAAFQLVDASEVADRLVSQVEAGPQGRAPDMGGPEVLDAADLRRVHREVTGRGIRVLQLPPIGGFMRGLAARRNLCPDQAVGRLTLADYLRWRETRG